MTDRITRKNVETLFESFKDAAVAAGVAEASRWHLRSGDSYCAYRVWLAHTDYAAAMAALPGDTSQFANGWSAHYSPVFGEGTIGDTPREAHNTLSAMTRAYWSVRNAQRDGDRFARD